MLSRRLHHRLPHDLLTGVIYIHTCVCIYIYNISAHKACLSSHIQAYMCTVDTSLYMFKYIHSCRVGLMCACKTGKTDEGIDRWIDGRMLFTRGRTKPSHWPSHGIFSTSDIAMVCSCIPVQASECSTFVLVL